MEFPDSYFEDEVREGFYVPSLMKRAWAAQMEVLEIVRGICDKHQIRYFAEWGTLLGAVRHGGRIPWDDDIDICMLREDYDRFREVANEELPEECSFWDCRYTEGFDNLVGRVINSRVHVVEGELLEKYHGFPYVAGIDIFWLDDLPIDAQAGEQYNSHIQYVYQLIDAIRSQEQGLSTMTPDELRYHMDKVETLCHVRLEWDRPIKTQLYEILDKMALHVCDEGEACEITNLPVWKNNHAYRLPKRCYEVAVSLPFENTDILVPAGYDELLARKYGDQWMNPVREGGSHDYPSYKKQQEYLREENGAVLFEFKYSGKEVEEIQAGRQSKETLQTRVRGFISLFAEAHEGVRQGVVTRDYRSSQQILEECQDVAIQLGTMIEQEKGEGHKTVGILEQYCEMIYRLHVALEQAKEEDSEDVIEAMLNDLTGFEQEFSGSIQCDLKEKKEIVFIPYQSSLWAGMDSVWRSASQEQDTDVYVIPAPYYYKDAHGRVKTEEPHYEMEGYPAEVKLTSYEKYDFQKRHPDRIVIQCPYDEYNYGMTIHPFFYAKNLVQYTDELVYIPAFAMDEIGPGDGRARENLKSYCNTPGVVYADTVIVQSEQMKDVYVELLTEFAGENTEKLWQDKIVAAHAGASDQSVWDPSQSALPENWRHAIKKADGGFKKVILYGTGVGSFHRHGMKMIKKMKEVFATFRAHRDEILVIWRPDPGIEVFLQSSMSDVWEAYCDLKKEFEEEGLGILDETPEMERAVLICDGYYGDGSAMGNACRAMGKAVMIQDVDVCCQNCESGL